MSFALGILVAFNAATCLLFAYDKWQAVRNGRHANGQKRHRHARVSENALLLSALCMGSVGALTAMYLFRHKTRKARFAYGVPLMCAIQMYWILFETAWITR